KSTLTVENCYSGTLSVEPQIMTVCPKRDATFTITLENTGKNKDTYTLETSDGTLEKDTVELESQKTGDIQLTVPANTEEKEVIINMFSEHTQETKTVTVSLKDEEKCYGFTVNANPGIIEANEYKGYLYTITVKNTGEYASEFSISPIGGPEWTYIDPTTQNIETGSEQQFFIYVSPPYGTEVGTYNIDIEVKRDNITTKTTTLKLILGKTATQETPSEKEDEPSIEEEPEEELPKTYPLTTDTEKTYEISENDTLTIESSYTKDNKETEVIINIRTGSFIIEIDDALIEDEEPELGENTYELTTEEKQYTITIEFTEVNATSNTYKFKVKDMQVTELKDETQDTPTGKVTDEQTSGVPKDIIYATIIGLIIIILILFGPEIAEKTKNFFTEEVEEKKDEEDKEDDWTPATLHKEDQIPLDEIKGIGDKRKDALRKSGIESANDLAEASISDIMAEAVTSEKQAKNLIRKAKLLVKKKAKEQEAKEEPKEKPKPKAKKPKKSKPRKEVKEDIKDILESI
ncbi:MAG: helix-hairpin-helix domain-containing protein, partial [Candidatus Aenigmarchaeota archaeon]|nr:helix-hairpin-helix domain-containing protein [Candidatus Aenigmarchaeota archaeon]